MINSDSIITVCFLFMLIISIPFSFRLWLKFRFSFFWLFFIFLSVFSENNKKTRSALCWQGIITAFTLITASFHVRCFVQLSKLSLILLSHLELSSFHTPELSQIKRQLNDHRSKKSISKWRGPSSWDATHIFIAECVDVNSV